MHSVIGGGVMNRPTGAGSTYRLPHVVHSQRVATVSSFAFSEVEGLKTSMRWESNVSVDEVWLSAAALEGWFPMATAEFERMGDPWV